MPTDEAPTNEVGQSPDEARAKGEEDGRHPPRLSGCAFPLTPRMPRTLREMPPSALVVHGSSLAATRRRPVAEAERAARASGAELVVLTGWAPTGDASEAELMRGIWRGPSAIELVLEE